MLENFKKKYISIEYSNVNEGQNNENMTKPSLLYILKTIFINDSLITQWDLCQNK
jgi:hypothetical protein